MVEEAKALAAFIKEGGTVAALSLSLFANLFLYRKTQSQQDQLLAQEGERRSELSKEKDRFASQVIELSMRVMVSLDQLNQIQSRRRAQPKGGGGGDLDAKSLPEGGGVGEKVGGRG